MGYISEKIGNLEHEQRRAKELATARQELEDAKTLLRFQEMHKSAELIKDRERLDWLLKNSHIRFETMDGCKYATCRETIDAEMQPANDKLTQDARP